MRPRNPVLVIRSCRSPEQLKVATAFVELWLRRMGADPKGAVAKLLHVELTCQTVRIFHPLLRGPGEQHVKNVLSIEPKRRERERPQENHYENQ